MDNSISHVEDATNMLMIQAACTFLNPNANYLDKQNAGNKLKDLYKSAKDNNIPLERIMKIIDNINLKSNGLISEGLMLIFSPEYYLLN